MAGRVVLVVEDDPDIREATRLILEEEAGCTVFTAADGVEALELLPRMPHPALILLDLMMPRMDGAELLKVLRADDVVAAIPIVIVSAMADPNMPGATRVVRKPVAIDTLLSLV